MKKLETYRKAEKEIKSRKSESRGLMRECVAFINENSEGWQRSSAEETKRIQEKERPKGWK